MPASICLYCSIVFRPGFLPGSHGICPPCLQDLDPEIFADLYPEALTDVAGPATLQARTANESPRR
jgi:hypothetical protein